MNKLKLKLKDKKIKIYNLTWFKLMPYRKSTHYKFDLLTKFCHP